MITVGPGFQRWADRMSADVRPAILRELGAAADASLATAATSWPVDTGRSREALYTRAGGLRVEVGCGVRYARYLPEWTRLRDEVVAALPGAARRAFEAIR